MTGLIDHFASFVSSLTEPCDQGPAALEMREALLSSSSELLQILESSPSRTRRGAPEPAGER